MTCVIISEIRHGRGNVVSLSVSFEMHFMEPNNPENEQEELNASYGIISEFIATKDLANLNVWAIFLGNET